MSDCPLVPIVPVVVRWTHGGRECSRTQLPLTLAWGITIHKSQGLTLAFATLELGEKDFALGLSYVAISRVKDLKGLAFRSPFAIGRLQKATPTPAMETLLADNQRRRNLGFRFESYGEDLSMYEFAVADHGLVI